MAYRFRAVVPELPSSDEWLPYLKPSIEANWYTNFGPVNTQFEDRLSALYSGPEESVVTAANATAGLSVCLIAEMITGPVLCPAFTFQATAASILGANCTPFIIDVEPDCGVVSRETLEEGFRASGAKAAIVLAPYGIKTDFKVHQELCQEMGKLLIIDNAAGLGIPRGALSSTGGGENVREVYSLHATKPFGIGEGAAIFAPSSKVAGLRAAMNFGLQTHTATGDRQPPFWGINGKMSEFHAAIGLSVADTIEKRISGRQEMARRWIKCLENLPVQLFSCAVYDATWQVFPILFEKESQARLMIKFAEQRGIELRRYYSPSLGECSGMPQLHRCLNAKNLAERVVVLPIRSQMEEAVQDELMSLVCECISNSCETTI